MAEFLDWAQRMRPICDVTRKNAEVMISLVHDRLRLTDLRELRPGHMRELLQELYPRFVLLQDERFLIFVIPVARELVRFLVAEGLSEADGDRMQLEIDYSAPLLSELVLNPEYWGEAKAAGHALLAAQELDRDEEEALVYWFEMLRSRLDRVGVSDYAAQFGLPQQLPPVRLPDRAELVCLARSSPLLEMVERFAGWLGPGRLCDRDGVLNWADAVEAANDLDVTRDDLERLAAIASSLTFTQHARGLLRMRPDSLGRWRMADPDFVLDAWASALSLLIVRTPPGGQPESPLDLDYFHEKAMVELVIARENGLTVDAAVEAGFELATGALPRAERRTAWETWALRYPAVVCDFFLALVDHGAAEFDGCRARITPLALSAMREAYGREGVEMLLLPAPERMSAVDLLHAVRDMENEEADAEIALWLGAREPRQAARQLIAAGAVGDSADRVRAIAVAMSTGADLRPIWQDSLGVRTIRPHALLALNFAAGRRPADALPELRPTADDLAWLLLDLLSTPGLAAEPSSVGTLFGECVPDGAEIEVIEHIHAQRDRHPLVHWVLTLIADRHPDADVALSAQSAADRTPHR
ncbi:hypothetical protein D5S17_08335 [Pseudonocardiaceae bacterium YIM PH 21723]|nr:hypothetical protein D5S17_08335 [Pseudonocardiaceae bacterium YIM PH 21723]